MKETITGDVTSSYDQYFCSSSNSWWWYNVGDISPSTDDILVAPLMMSHWLINWFAEKIRFEEGTQFGHFCRVECALYIHAGRQVQSLPSRVVGWLSANGIESFSPFGERAFAHFRDKNWVWFSKDSLKTFVESSLKAGWLSLKAQRKPFKKHVNRDITNFCDKIAYMLGVLFLSDDDHCSALL